MKIQQYLVADWFIRFTAGYKDREDDLGVKCRLLEIRNSRKIFWTGGRIMGLNQMKVELYTNQEIIHQILHENSGRGTSVQSAPYSLRDEQKNCRCTTCKHFIQTSLHFLNCGVTGDEYWVFQYDPETKLQGVE